MTLDELNKIAGVKFTNADATDGNCGYSTDDGSKLVIVSWDVNPEVDVAKRAYPSGRDISGIGKAAWWSSDVGLFVDTNQGGSVTIEMVGFDTSGGKDNEPTAAAIAQVVLPRLPAP